MKGFQTIAPVRCSASWWDVPPPSRVKPPEVGFTNPNNIPMVVVLPEPLGPEQPEDVAPTHFQRDAVHGDDTAVSLG